MTPTAVICAIVLDEQRYIDEWISYHRKLGFGHVYLYDNSDTHSMKYVGSDFVTVIHWPGKKQQIRAYDHFAKTHRDSGAHTWAAFIDVDEFIVLLKHETIVDFLAASCPDGSVCLNWYLFGSNGHETYQPRPVLERFTKRQSLSNPHVKSIVRLRDFVGVSDPHSFVTTSGTTRRDCVGRPVPDPGSLYDDPGAVSVQVARINHYFCKSREEFEIKRNRGRADVDCPRRPEEFDQCDFNDVEDTGALDFFNR